jgi:hypothetical protein
LIGLLAILFCAAIFTQDLHLVIPSFLQYSHTDCLQSSHTENRAVVLFPLQVSHNCFRLIPEHKRVEFLDKIKNECSR